MNVNFDARSAFVIQKFKENLPLTSDSVMYTKVPRGLVVSIPDDKIFAPNSTKLTSEGEILLDAIGKVLKMFNNKCAIESHTSAMNYNNPGYKDSWEISIHRANVITDYLINKCKIETLRLYPIGFGDTMPFYGNVAQEDFKDNRIDFVIFDYYTRR